MTVSAKFAVVAILAALLCLLVEYNVSGINGPWYWQWPWRRIDPIRVVAPMLLAAAPIALAQWLYFRKRSQSRLSALEKTQSYSRAARETVPEARVVVFPIILAMLSLGMMMLVSVGVQKWPFHLKRIVDVIGSQQATSYYQDAVGWVSDPARPGLLGLLGDYPHQMTLMRPHSRLRPPGPVLFHAIWVKLAGPGHRSAMLGGLAIIALATLSVPATYCFVRHFAPDNPDGAFHAACFVALSPALVWFTPMFDQIYPVLTALLVCSWSSALRDDSIRWSITFGIAMAFSLFVTFNVLVLGVILLGLAIVTAMVGAGGVRLVMRHIAIAGAALVGVYLLLWGLSGYNPMAVFASALHHQAELVALIDPPRPYPATVAFDVLDFLMGAGWIAAPLVVFCLLNRKTQPLDSMQRIIVYLGLFQIVAVALSGMLSVETARVWIFLQPLVALPIGLELSTWPPRAAAGVYAAQFALLTSIGGNMWLIVE